MSNSCCSHLLLVDRLPGSTVTSDPGAAAANFLFHLDMHTQSTCVFYLTEAEAPLFSRLISQTLTRARSC